MSYPKINDDRFYSKINSKFAHYTIPKKKKSIKEICFPKKYALQIPQKFLAKLMNPETPYKNVLVFHQIGAGKTCAAVNIAEHCKHKMKIIVVTPASLLGNFRNELRTPCAKNAYISDRDRKRLKETHPSSPEHKAILAKSDKLIDRHYQLLSYNKFVEAAEEDELVLSNRLLIVDEVQNMISDAGKYYQTLLQVIDEAPSSLRVVLLSATPMFDRPVEIALTMNLLRLPKPIPVGREFEKMFIESKRRGGKYTYSTKNLDLFKEMIKGRVSHFRGAPPHAFPEGIIRYVKCPMSNFQYRSYLTVLANEDKEKQFDKLRNHKLFKDGDIIHLPNNFFIGTRIISNIAFPNRNINESGLESLEMKHMLGPALERYSPKFFRIMRKIRRCRGTVFVYSNFKEFGGIRSFARVLEAYGFQNYVESGQGRKRFAIWSGTEKVSVKEEIKSVFNRPENANGSLIKVVLGSPSIKEGVSLLRVQQVHILEPYWNQSRLDQVIGRAIRYCSHKDMPPEKRIVKVYIYIAIHEHEDETIDQYIYKLAAQKNRLIKEFERALKESAIDCTLFKYANVHPGDPPIECER